MGGVYVGHLEFAERIRGGSKISLRITARASLGNAYHTVLLPPL